MSTARNPFPVIDWCRLPVSEPFQWPSSLGTALPESRKVNSHICSEDGQRSWNQTCWQNGMRGSLEGNGVSLQEQPSCWKQVILAEWVVSVGEDLFSPMFSSLLRTLLFSMQKAVCWVIFSIYCYNSHCKFLLIGAASFAWLVDMSCQVSGPAKAQELLISHVFVSVPCLASLIGEHLRISTLLFQ